MKETTFSRRHFFFGSLLAGAVPAAGSAACHRCGMLGYKSPNEKLNIASIGAGGKASSDISGCAPKTSSRCAMWTRSRPRASSRNTRRSRSIRTFARCSMSRPSNIDAVIVTIPDFMHATAATWCMERGKHVYVQKPLTRTVWEARQMTEAANKYKVATQMGNQGYSNEGTRQAAEMIWAGEIGNVTEVHAWTDRPIWPQGLTAIPPPNPFPPLSTGISGSASPRSGPTPPAARITNRRSAGISISPSTGVAFTISVAARWAIWPATFWARRIWRCAWVRRTSVECIQKEGVERLHVPEEIRHPLRFPGARQHAARETVLA